MAAASQAPPLDCKVPKAVLLAREKLKAENMDITAETLGKALTSSDLSALAASMRYALKKDGCAGLNDSYKNLNTDEERRKWMADFCVDPCVSRCFAFNSTSRETESGIRGRKLWLTIEQMSSPIVFNSLEHAKIVAKKAPERPSSFVALAEAGIKEYYIEVTEEVFARLTKEQVGVKADGGNRQRGLRQGEARLGRDDATTESKAPEA